MQQGACNASFHGFGRMVEARGMSAAVLPLSCLTQWVLCLRQQAPAGHKSVSAKSRPNHQSWHDLEHLHISFWVQHRWRA